MVNNTDNSFKNQDYKGRVNRVVDYIVLNMESQRKLELSELAKVAGFSPFHFHRIFKAFLDETPSGFIKRLRLEKVASLLRNNEQFTITQIAYHCGFPSSQVLSRDFKIFFGISPREYREGKNFSKICNEISKNRKEIINNFGYDVIDNCNCRISNNNKKYMDLKVEIKELPELSVLYLRHIGSFKGNSQLFGSMFNKLCSYAYPKGLINKDSWFLAVYHDDPEITDENKARLDVALSVDPSVKPDGEFGVEVLKKGRFIVAHFVLKSSADFEAAWGAVYRDYLPQSGFIPDNRPCYEIYLNDPKTDPEGKHIVDICVPIK